MPKSPAGALAYLAFEATGTLQTSWAENTLTTMNIIYDILDIASIGMMAYGGIKLRSNPLAQGDHSVFLKTANGTKYSTYKANPQSPSGFDLVKRYDPSGPAHFNKPNGPYVPTPHVQEGNTARPPLRWEIPK